MTTFGKTRYVIGLLGRCVTLDRTYKAITSIRKMLRLLSSKSSRTVFKYYNLFRSFTAIGYTLKTASASSVVIKRNLKYYLVCDLEATCVSHPQQDWEPEIIEIGAILLDQNLKKISEFQKFVCPDVNKILTPFCLGLTKIRQRDVDQADPFPNVYGEMLKWMTENGLQFKPTEQNFTFVTDGIFDCNKFIRNQCNLSMIEYPKWAIEFSNIKKHFRDIVPHKQRKNLRSTNLTGMLKVLKIPMDGQLHRAMDDAKMVVKIMEGLRKRRPNYKFTANETIHKD
ncbi:3'-5' exoribonuclease 1-like isoform X1 [Anneissia japonica]|uniref:3'-5' exoribonuclease 1-like isoform X1 n=1 Tax=Anneissia japonica TaxID=1529436 RepID=UPI001425A25A|nr:3'-5' exoribonuclease 1-like isoform X1 [Anneissia japonica]